jgi:hypothetical protein
MGRSFLSVASRAVRTALVGLLGAGFVPLHTGFAQAQSILQNKLIYKAKVDECFYGIGDPKNTPANFQSPCPNGAVSKVNGAYVWGMTESSVSASESYIWFGTVNDYLCQVIQTLFVATNTTPLPFKTPSYVCEFNKSQFPNPGPSAGNFDWRLPQIYRYNLKTPATPPVLATKSNGMLTSGMETHLSQTQGIRSAGSTDKIVFLGGPSGQAGLPYDGSNGPALFANSITLFAFTPAGTPKGSKRLPYTDIRKWVFANGHLYAGVQFPNGTGGVLHWVGTPNAPFSCPQGNLNCDSGFEIVGKTDAEVANLTTLNGRLYATTWGGFNGPFSRKLPLDPSYCPYTTGAIAGSNCLSGLWVSPAFHSTSNGTALSPADSENWKETWHVGQYEPDFATAFSIVGGAVEAYKGQIYWGTMQVPMTGYITHCLLDASIDPKACSLNDATPAGALAALILTVRPTAVFRNNGSVSQPVTESLYGAAKLPKYTATGATSGAWGLADNKMGGVAPTFGPIGFGNPFNAYSWSSAVYQNRFYIGTFDWSYVAYDGLSALASVLGFDPNSGPLSSTNLQTLLNNYPTTLPTSDDLWKWSETSAFIQALKQQNTSLAFGADLWRFDSATVAAKAESINGLGNPLNYGIRSMVSDTARLWPGTANPMNLKTTPGQPNGGWEFRALTGQPVF